MKKIGILTHYYRSTNLGGLLQSYALTEALCKHGYAAEQISFEFTKYDILAQKTIRRYQAKRSLFSYTKIYLITVGKKLLRCMIKSAFYKQFQMQKTVISIFANAIPHTHLTYINDTIPATNSMYDIFVVGSDQIWNTDFLPHRAYYGEFATSDKKVIAYAASSNVKQFPPKAEELFIQKLARLNAISVREKTLKDYIERITDKKATVVLDPTFLLPPEEWLKISNPKPVPQNPYIFCYFLGSKSAWQRKVVQAYADKYGYETIHLPYIMQTIRPSDRFLKGQGRYDVGPREFIALINNAQCVFTDSFHGLAFSINFGKNFYVFNRDDEAGADSMNARITDTLAMFGLGARHITDKNVALDNAPLNFTRAHQILEVEKQKSINWLLNTLKEGIS